jgi:hypothetical protein
VEDLTTFFYSFSSFWIFLGIAIVLVGPASGVWTNLRIKNIVIQIEASNTSFNDKLKIFIDQWKDEREDTKTWLMALQEKTTDNEKAIGEVIAVLKDRQER